MSIRSIAWFLIALVLFLSCNAQCPQGKKEKRKKVWQKRTKTNEVTKQAINVGPQRTLSPMSGANIQHVIQQAVHVH